MVGCEGLIEIGKERAAQERLHGIVKIVKFLLGCVYHGDHGGIQNGVDLVAPVV